MSENNAIMQGGSVTESCVLQISDLHKSYGSHPVLEGVSFSIPRGKIVGLLGPNGCGKSTIMKMISGLLPADNGSILIDGHLPGLVSKSIVSYLPERTYLNDWMKVSEVRNFSAILCRFRFGTGTADAGRPAPLSQHPPENDE